MPLGNIGLLAPQIGLASAVPVLVPVVAAGLLVSGGAYFGYRAWKKRRA